MMTGTTRTQSSFLAPPQPSPGPAVGVGGLAAVLTIIQPTWDFSEVSFPSSHAEILRFIYTLFLFTKSDIKTILIPITVFGTLAAPQTSWARLPHTIAWTWIFLLQFCVSNQSLSPDEDAANKPWRPIPAGRVSIAAAVLMRWILLPLCLLVSYAYGVVLPALALTVGIILNNELKLDSHWITRNICNALGYAAFSFGATGVACGKDSALNATTLLAHTLSSLTVLITIHAQDFQDVKGDAICGRFTLPIVFPKGSRHSMAWVLPLWSIFLSQFWGIDVQRAAMLLLLAVFCGMRFIIYRDAAADRLSYLYYNVWLCMAQVIPFMLVR